MARYAVIRNQRIDNIIEWDGVTEYDPGEGAELRLLEDGSPVTIGDEVEPEPGAPE